MTKNFFLLFNLLIPALLVAQTPYERLGQRFMMSGDFKNAALYFEKAYTSDNTNMNVLYLLGYSHYHAVNYRKSIHAFDKLIGFKPDENIAYYYRGKAKLLLAGQIQGLKSDEKDHLLKGAIRDFSAGIELNSGDSKFYQNRALAYQEYAIYKSQKITGVYNKSAVISAANNSISDFNKVLSDNSYRKDIVQQIEKSKQIIMDNK